MGYLSILLHRIKNVPPKPDPSRPIGIAPTVRSLEKHIAFWAIAILLAGCGQSPTPTPLPGVVYREETVVLPASASTPEPSPSNTRVMPLEVLTPEPIPTITPIPDEARGLVIEIIDGDTIAVVIEGDPPGQAYVVRYIGIDAPPNTPDEPWGVVAYEANRRMTKLKVVRLVRDQTDFDDEGRLLRYVYVDDELMSVILAEQGLAGANIVEPDARFQVEIEAAEARVRDGQLGLWGQPPTPTPPAGQPTASEQERTPEPETTTTPGATTTGAATTEPAEPAGTAETAQPEGATTTTEAVGTATTAEPAGTAETPANNPSTSESRGDGAATATADSSTSLTD